MSWLSAHINIYMSKVIQWYVTKQHVNPHDRSILSNYFPWNDLKSKTINQIFREMNTNIGEAHIGRFSFKSDFDYHTWKDYHKETEIKFIDTDGKTFNPRDLNIFPIRFRANEDHVFMHKALCPFGHLPKSVIEWLRHNKQCSIVFHDANEAKAITSKEFVTIPGLISKRKEYNLENKFVYLDSRANADVLHEKSYYPIPDWLVFIGCSNWLQFVGHTASKKDIDEVIRLSNRRPLFKQGRFLFYSGRLRPARYLIMDHLLKDIKREHLWLSASNAGVNPSDIRSILDYSNQIQTESNLKTYYTATDREKIVDLSLKTPINTFPEQLQEEKVDYHKLKWFWIPNPAHYSRAFIDISCETYNERHGAYGADLFITEKICKPILAKRPFICSANPGLYQELKKLGFITFNKWWDESFAEECDIKQHIQKLIRVITKLDKLTDAECKEMWDDMQDVLQHNQDTLLYYTHSSPRAWITELRKARHKKLI